MTNRTNRHKRIRAKLSGTKDMPRVAVFRSNRYISAQVIDDTSGKTLAMAKGPKNKPEPVAEALAKKVLDAGITNVVFDRGGHMYHGHVKAFADALRSKGLKF